MFIMFLLFQMQNLGTAIYRLLAENETMSLQLFGNASSTNSWEMLVLDCEEKAITFV